MTRRATEPVEEASRLPKRIYLVKTHDGIAIEEAADHHVWTDDNDVLKLYVGDEVVAKFTEPYEWFHVSRDDWEQALESSC